MSALDLDALERRARKGLVLSPDETLALITRLRAAEARTAWQPIETAPHGEWVLVYGTRFRAALPSVEPARLDEYGWADKGGYSVFPIAWHVTSAVAHSPPMIRSPSMSRLALSPHSASCTVRIQWVRRSVMVDLAPLT